jgi:hypothetical protein
MDTHAEVGQLVQDERGRLLVARHHRIVRRPYDVARNSRPADAPPRDVGGQESFWGTPVRTSVCGVAELAVGSGVR